MNENVLRHPNRRRRRQRSGDRDAARPRRPQGRWCSSAAIASAAARGRPTSLRGFAVPRSRTWRRSIRRSSATLDLARHGLRIIRPDTDACAPTVGERALVLWRDQAQAAQEIRAFSAATPIGTRAFSPAFRESPRCFAVCATRSPRRSTTRTLPTCSACSKPGERFAASARLTPTACFAGCRCQSPTWRANGSRREPLRSVVAAGGVLGSFLGPRSAGSAALLLLLGAGEGQPIANGWFAAGGPGALAEALVAAARQAGVEIRTLSDVARINVVDEAATGVTLTTGEVILARTVCRTSIRSGRCSIWSIAIHLGPEFVRRVQNLRSHGTLAKINYAVDALPRFTGRSLAAAPSRSRHSRAASGSRETSTPSSGPSTRPSTADSRPSRGSN